MSDQPWRIKPVLPVTKLLGIVQGPPRDGYQVHINGGIVSVTGSKRDELELLPPGGVDAALEASRVTW